MPKGKVYVVQVRGGDEERARRAIAREMGEDAQDVFTPLCEVPKLFHGSWRTVRALLFPGYVFVQARDPEPISRALRAVPGLTRLLGAPGESVRALTGEEAAWLDAVIDSGTHTMGMSEAVQEGDRVVVVTGPLRGRESQIVKVDRHKRVAWIEVQMLGRRTQVKVGLEVVRKRGA